ncbi:putative leader peptide [Rhodococcoides kyotonense]|uniref:Uncharacterized protein n=1 Tax=Rhodococcoides kyotonense TaxID=398843 RepID=A0A239GDW6_9NOCA|nr:putative leader peptide [Rhodococcus kyotonensis]SNS67387.1 hypothetical protein SAMN05421642_104195 [Rhodococcus kyotonensis]
MHTVTGGHVTLSALALGEGFVTAWGRIHVDLCRLTGSICRSRFLG